MKTGRDALGTVENESGSAKDENGTRHPKYRRIRVWGAKHENGMPSVLPKTSQGAQNMKKGPDAPRSAEKCPGAENITTRRDALGITENES
jgi:hypothetical protein